mmetsp:Transcript_95775/g.166401  ORF Transcript_95775/g.166401 Transcript_95775/m.166401 type:complete len:108 (+) Transcript_95775:134-457(+)
MASSHASLCLALLLLSVACLCARAEVAAADDFSAGTSLPVGPVGDVSELNDDGSYPVGEIIRDVRLVVSFLCGVVFCAAMMQFHSYLDGGCGEECNYFHLSFASYIL